MERARRSKERLERMVSVRLTAAEEAAVREEAARRGLSVSNLMRMAALREARPAVAVPQDSSITAAAGALPSLVVQSTSTVGACVRSGTFSTT